MEKMYKSLHVKLSISLGQTEIKFNARLITNAYIYCIKFVRECNTFFLRAYETQKTATLTRTTVVCGSETVGSTYRPIKQPTLPIVP